MTSLEELWRVLHEFCDNCGIDRTSRFADSTCLGEKSSVHHWVMHPDEVRSAVADWIEAARKKIAGIVEACETDFMPLDSSRVKGQVISLEDWNVFKEVLNVAVLGGGEGK